MDDEKNELSTNVQELVEVVRAIQREKLTALEREHAELIAFRNATQKISEQQKLILIWLWQQTLKFESYLNKNDTDHPEYMQRLRHQWENAAADKYDLLREYYTVLNYKSLNGGVLWRHHEIIEEKLTCGVRASLSRSLRHLVERELVQRCPSDPSYLFLTRLGRNVSVRLTLSV